MYIIRALYSSKKFFLAISSVIFVFILAYKSSDFAVLKYAIGSIAAIVSTYCAGQSYIDKFKNTPKDN